MDKSMETNKINQVLFTFLNEKLSFLFFDEKFKITNTLSTNFFGGDSQIFLTSDKLNISLVSDKGQIFLDIGSVFDRRKRMYSIDLFKYLIENIKISDLELSTLKSAEMKKENISFLESHLSDIESLLNKLNFEKTIKKLNLFSKKRGDVMFE